MPLIRYLVALMSSVLLAGGLAVPAQAAPPPGVITEVPLVSGDLQGIAIDEDGNAWTVKLSTGKVVRITPVGEVAEFSPPTANSGPRDITIGPDGNLWFTQGNVNQIGRITPAGEITEFPLSTGGSPNFITAGADGNLWYLAANNNNVNRLSTAGQVTGSFPISNGAQQGIALGPDGNVWFTQTSTNRIGRITPSGAITEFLIPTANSSPNDITAGPDGNLWFTESVGNKIGRITPDGTFTEYPLPTANSSPRQITSDRDGSLRFVENFGARIGKITSGVSPTDRRPALNGTGQAGLPLVCGADVWGATSTVTIGWQRNGQAIPGQSGVTYTPTAAEIGTAITCTSTGRLPGVVTPLRATSNPITVVAQLSGPVGPRGIDGKLSAVFAPGTARVKAGKTLKVRFGMTNAAALTAQLKGKKTLTKSVQAKAGTNTLTMKVPKSLKPGKYTLRLLSGGASLTSTRVKVTR